jgi:hypothetical protein
MFAATSAALDEDYMVKTFGKLYGHESCRWNSPQCNVGRSGRAEGRGELSIAHQMVEHE